MDCYYPLLFPHVLGVSLLCTLERELRALKDVL